MAVYYKTKGFVFKKENRGEADKIFSIFTHDYGKIELRCRGIRKINSKLRYNIDNFYYSEIEFVQGKNYKTLTDASIINKPQLTLSKLEFLNNIAELLDSFIKGEQRDDKIFDLLSKTFENLLKIKSYKLRNFYNYFFWNFI